MKNRLIIFTVILIILLLLFSVYLYFSCNGLVILDGKYVPKVHLVLDEHREHLFIPVVAMLCEMGYEKTPGGSNIINLRSKDQTITLDLNSLSLTCPQSPINCIARFSENTYYYCERQGNDVLIDTGTFSVMLAYLDCKYQIILADPQSKILKLAYNEGIDYSQFLEKYQGTLLEERPAEEQPNRITEARLIVNGVDITEGNHVTINHEEENAELPILAILRALGFDAKMQYNKSLDIYESVIDAQIGFFSTEHEDFGIPYRMGEKGCVRKIENNDFVVDYKCVFTQMYWFWHADISIDFLNSTVYVDSCDPWA